MEIKTKREQFQVGISRPPELMRRNLPFVTLSGDWETRYRIAVDAIVARLGAMG
jgi:hypothetical protein